MNFGNFGKCVLFRKFLQERFLISVRQSYSRPEREIKKKFQLRPEPGGQEAQDPGGGEGDHVLGPGGHENV